MDHGSCNVLRRRCMVNTAVASFVSIQLGFSENKVMPADLGSAVKVFQDGVVLMLSCSPFFSLRFRPVLDFVP
jgi:hypothetical protein